MESSFVGPPEVSHTADSYRAPVASPFHMFTFEVWPDPMPAGSYPMLLPEHMTVKATDADQAREFAAQAIKPGQTATLTGHIRSQCYPAHPGER